MKHLTSRIALASSLLLTAPVAATAACTGDCDAGGSVTVDEIITGVNIALGTAALSTCTAFDASGDSAVTVDEIVTSIGAALEGCPSEGEGLGIRRFSLDPRASKLEILGLPLSLVSTTFEGFMELEAGPEDAEGLRPLHVTDISPYFSVNLRPPIGSPIILCLKPVVESLPIRDVGALACNGFDQAGVNIRVDHNTGMAAPMCGDGNVDVNPAHAGVCNGPFDPEILPGEPGPGAVAITPDPETLEGGLQFEVITEAALPCGDEGLSGIPAPFVLSTGIGRATISDRDNLAGTTLTAERRGENFDCANWTVENGPGRMVFLAPLLDFNAGPLGMLDIITAFVLDD